MGEETVRIAWKDREERISIGWEEGDEKVRIEWEGLRGEGQDRMK